jgi:hypothetical protein
MNPKTMFIWDDYDSIYLITDTHAVDYPETYKNVCKKTIEELECLRNCLIIHLGDRGISP